VLCINVCMYSDELQSGVAFVICKDVLVNDSLFKFMQSIVN
jgi:hypothetical protein